MLFRSALFSTHYNKKIICGKGGDLFGGPVQEAVDGMVHETVRAKIACVYWDVTEKAVF